MEVRVESVQSLVPQSLVLIDPVVDRLQGEGIDPVEPLTSLGTGADQTHVFEHLEMLRHLRLGHGQLGDDVTDGLLAVGEDVEDVPTPRFGDGIERICCGGGSGHAD